MNVLNLLDSINRGGTETLLLDICKSKNKYLNIYLATALGGDLEEEFITSKVKLFKYKRRFKFDPFAIYSIRKIIKENKVDIIHTHLWIDALYAFIAKFGLKVKLVHTIHAFDIYKDPKYKLTIRLILRITNLNIYVSDFIKNHYLNKYSTNKKNTTIYNGINIEKFNCEKHNLKKELNLSDNNILFGMVGNFVNTGRDQFFICKSLTEIVKKYPNFHFVFIGGKSNKTPFIYDQCIDYCKDESILDNVHFIGPRNNVPAILKSLDGFVYATNHDTFGIAVVEAIISGIPVLTNDFPVMIEITENGKLANLYKTKDEDDLNNCITNMIENINFYKKKAIEVSKKANDKYCIDNHLSILIDNYKKILCSKI